MHLIDEFYWHMGFKVSEGAEKVIIAIIALIFIIAIIAIIRADSNRHGHSRECMAGTAQVYCRRC